MTLLDLRLRVTSPELLALPWSEPLADWDPTAVELRDLPVGPSRHLVRFVEADGRLWALKDLPRRLAVREYDVLRDLERRQLAAVRVAGVVMQPGEDAAILVTHYLERSWQYRRLLMRVPGSMRVHRARLFDAMALLLVDLHRNGVYWGDCSLANTLFMRDGQSIQAWMVDAETAELHPALSDGQRADDLERTVENVAGGLLDVAARRQEPAGSSADLFDEARSVGERYAQLWELLFDAPLVDLGDHDRIAGRLHKLQEMGFELDEIRFEPAGEPTDQLRMRVSVAGRSFHADQFRALTGRDVGEGQAAILLNDLRAYHAALQRRSTREVTEDEAARRWLDDVFRPGVEVAHRAVGQVGDPTQAYCDLLEVRWLLSEEAGADVGDDPALRAMAEHQAPGEAAANLAVVDMATQELPAVPPGTATAGETSGGGGHPSAQQPEAHPSDRDDQPVRDHTEDQ